MTFDIYPHLMKMPNKKVRELVTENEDGSFSVFIDSSLSSSQQLEAYHHALEHIQADDFASDLPADVIEARAHGKDHHGKD